VEADSTLVQGFLARMEASFRVHPCWRGATPEVVEQAVEGLEKYLMSKLYPRTFAASREDADRDERYLRLTTALAFVPLSTLLGSEVEPEAALMAAAQVSRASLHVFPWLAVRLRGSCKGATRAPRHGRDPTAAKCAVRWRRVSWQRWTSTRRRGTSCCAWST